MTDLQDDIDRALKAEKLLSDPLLDQAFRDVEGAIHERWAECPLRDREGAHELKLQLKLLSDVRANLERAVADGKLAAHELEARRRESTPAEFSSDWHKV